MTHYIVVAFCLGLEWYLGKRVVELLGGIAGGIFRAIIPRRYWDVRHPDYLVTKKERKSKSNGRTIVKGFCKD